MQINSMGDCLKLQHEVNSFVAFFDRLGLSLDLEKCKAMTFNRIHTPIMFSYHLHYTIVSRCDESWFQAFQQP